MTDKKKTQELYTLTPEHEAQLKPWADKWIANAFNTERYTADNLEEIEQCMRSLYKAADLKEPRVVTFSTSPFAGAVAAGTAAGFMYLRDTAEQQKSTFKDGKYNERQSLLAAHQACVDVIQSGLNGMYGLEKTDTRDHGDPPKQILANVRSVFKAITGTKIEPGKADANVVTYYRQCIAQAYNMHNGGNNWSGWPAYLSFFRHVAKLDLDYSKWQHYEQAATYGPRFMHEEFCIVSERPVRLTVDERNLAHGVDGPYASWSDGSGLYFWHGTQVPREWIVAKDTVDPSTALTWPNVEQRRALAEILGWAKVLANVDARTINKNKNPEIGELIEVDLPDSPRQRFLRVRCGTGRDFVLPVPSTMKTAKEANAWTYGLTAEEFKVEVRT